MMKSHPGKRFKWMRGGAALLSAVVLALVTLNLNSWRVQVLPNPRGGTFQVVFSPDGRFLAAPSQLSSGSSSNGNRVTDSAVTVWQVVAPDALHPPRVAERRTLEVHYPTSICFSGDSSRLICTGHGPTSRDSDSGIIQWQVGTWRRLSLIPHIGYPAQNLQPQGDSFSYSTDNTAETRQQNSGRRQSSIPLTPKSSTNEYQQGVAFSPNGATVAVTLNFQQGEVVWNAIRLQKIRSKQARVLRFDSCGTSGCELSAPTFSPDSRFLVVARSYTHPKSNFPSQAGILWNLETGKIARRWSEPSDVNAYAFSPDGQLLAAACNDSSVSLRQIRTGTLLQNLKIHRIAARSVAFSPDGRTLASCDFDGVVALRRVR